MAYAKEKVDESLVGDYSAYSHSHFPHRVWALNQRVNAAITRALTEMPDPAGRQLISEFWISGIVEFHLYYLLPLLSVTACNGAQIQKILRLDRKSLTPNGLRLEGIRTGEDETLHAPRR